MIFLHKHILEKKYPLFNTSPAYWSGLKEVQQAFRNCSYTFPYKNYTYHKSLREKGIVTWGSAASWVSVYVLTSILRHHGCKLPIQVWYLGSSEYDFDKMSFIAEMDVEFVDVSSVIMDYNSRILSTSLCFTKMTDHLTYGDFAMKIFSIINSDFDQVLYMDCNCLPITNPEYIFESPQFIKYGMYFFPDAVRSIEEKLFLLTKKNCEIFGVKYLGERSFHTNQMFVDKTRCMDSLKQTFWWNDFADYTYQILFDDKSTFDLGARQTNTKYYLVQKPPVVDFGLHQFDHNDNLLFLNRCDAKWNETENLYLDRPQESLLHSFANKFIQKFKKNIKLYL